MIPFADFRPRFYIPRNLREEDYPSIWWVPICYFMELIHWRSICHQQNEQGFVQLHSTLLRKYMGIDYSKIIRLLEDRKVVEQDKISIKGQKATGYRITEEYRKTRLTYCDCPEMNRKIYDWLKKEEQELQPTHRWLLGKFDILEFDYELATEIIDNKVWEEVAENFTEEDYRHGLRRNADRMRDKNFYLTCDQYGRVHTAITNMPKEIRQQCLTIDGEHLVSHDIANMQPLMLVLVARQFFRDRFARKRLSAVEFKKGGNPYAYQAMASQKINQEIPSCIQDYADVTQSGRFYESFGMDREVVKKQFITVMCGPHNFQSVVKDKFCAMFPQIAGMLMILKRKDYRRVGHLLQNYESTIFIHQICNRLRHEKPNIPVYTVHDCILTTRRYSKYLESVIREEFASLGLKPTIKREDYNVKLCK